MTPVACRTVAVGSALVFVCLSSWNQTGRADPVSAAFLNAGAFNTEPSMSCGIQEAINALPPEGGTVFIPPGTNILRRPICLKPRTRLVGAGRSTVLKKDAAILLKITEDAKKGRNYIVVDDASKLRVGAWIVAGDRAFHPIWAHGDVITNIVGNRVGFGRQLDRDLAVARDARAMNLFVLIRPAPDSVVMDMELDGNAREQMVDFLNTTDVFTGYGMLWAGLYPGQGKVERCWIHDCGIGVHVSSKTGIEIRNCDIYRNTADGIHCGGGPHSMIVNNRLHDNGGGGVTFCYGNRKLIITGNEIMRNLAGICALGNGDPAQDTTADRYTIISDNIIYENQEAGIASGQGHLGPQDFTITGNIVQNNAQAHGGSGGIHFTNPQRCVIANNRCFDDRETFPRYMLAQPVPAGASNISITLADRNYHSEPCLLTNDWLCIGTGATAGVYAVTSVGEEKIRLNQPAPTNLPAETPVVRVAAQRWGIFVGGDEARDNVIVGNVCVGNRSGGIFVKGLSNNVVANNAGAIVLYDDAKLPLENYSPALARIAVTNGGFEEDGGWVLEKGSAYDNSAGVAHSGRRALKLIASKEKRALNAFLSSVPIQPNCRYRLRAWVRFNARTAADDIVLPNLFIWANGRNLGRPTVPRGYTKDPGPSGWDVLTWIQVGTEFQSGLRDNHMRIYCFLEQAVSGEAWVDDITLELIDRLAPPAGNLAPDRTVKVSAADSPPALDGRLDDPVWRTAAPASFPAAGGRSATWATAARICYDRSYVYVGFECADPHLAELRHTTTNEAGVFQDDAVAMLIQPDPLMEDHLQFAVSAGGARFDQFYGAGGRDTLNFNPDWQATVATNSAGWTAEMRIPLALLAALPPAPGTVWGANFGRHLRDGGWPSWCATKNWHAVRDYGLLLF